MNAGALVAGLALFPLIRSLGRVRSALADGLILALGSAIPLVALLGERVDGVSRWFFVGGITIQPAWVAIPLIAIAFAIRPNSARLAAVALAAAGCALQPDLGAAAMLLLAVAAAAIVSRTRETMIAVILALAAVTAAALRPVGLLPVPFAEQVLPDALAAGAFPGLLALAGMFLLFLPAYLLRRSAPTVALAAFVGIWSGALLAALLGSYPTPILGFGGSAVLGYILSVAALGRSAVAMDRRSSMLPPATGRI